MERKIKVIREGKADGSINQFIIECLFRKYFEEKEIALAAPQGRPRKDESIAVQASSR